MNKFAWTCVGAGLAVIAAILWNSTPIRMARAGVACSVPFTFVNGTTADATQVNSNFNSLVACLANAAQAGVNSDITQLAGLTTPLPPNEGGSWVYVATATSTGTANAQVIAATSPSGFSLTIGKKIVFNAGFVNTGATTLNVAGTGVTNLLRQTPSGAVPMVGGEIVGTITEATYDGVEFILTSNPGGMNLPPGAVFDYAGAAGCPLGSAQALGGNLATATFPTLSAVLGTSWGNPGGGNFTLPDLRGRTTFGIDNGQLRITVAGGNFDGTVFANTGGQQNQTLTVAQIPTLTFSGTAQTWSTNQTGIAVNLSAQGGFATGSAGVTAGIPSGVITISAATTTITPSGTLNGGGGSHPVLSNGAIVLKCVKE